jgi:hypothetical protein
VALNKIEPFTQILALCKSIFGVDIIKNLSNTPQSRKILFIASNPTGTSMLRIDREVRDIEKDLRHLIKEDKIQLEIRLAQSPKDLASVLLEIKPDILHFSGHGDFDGIFLEDENGESRKVSNEAIGELFCLFCGSIKCVVLNSCYSENQAREISKYIPFVVGMSNEIPDPAAIVFATSFYHAIGKGESIEFAFNYGIKNISIEGLKGSKVPLLFILDRNRFCSNVRC